MKITVVAIGMLREYLPSKSTVIDIEDGSTVRALTEILRGSLGEVFYQRIMQNNNLAPYIIALLNGLSISMKNGLDTELRDGDRLVFTIMVNGG